MIRYLVFFYLLVMAGNSFAGTTWYSSDSQAFAAAGCSVKTGESSGASMCINGWYNRYICGGNYYAYCLAGYIQCSVSGQTRDINGICSCPTGKEVYLNQCVDVCPSGSSRLSDGTCSVPIPSCTSLGVNVNDFIPKCSEMIDGSPSVCLNSDGGQFSIAGCPSIQCEDGSSVIYPATCPVSQCAEGFELVDIGQGYGKTCVKPLPSDEENKFCTVTPGGSQPLCASDDQPFKCLFENGSFVCLRQEDSPQPGQTCYTSGTKYFCVSNQPQIETTKQIETQQDGTVKETEIIQPNIDGVPPVTRETITNPDGSQTIKSNHPGDAFAVMSLNKLQPKIDLSKVEKNTLDTADNTKSISDKLNELFDKVSEFIGDESDYDKSDIEFDGLDDKLNQDRASFEAFVNQSNPAYSLANQYSLSSAFSSLLPSDSSCSGGINTTIFGKEFIFEPCEKLAPLREILAWFFSVWSAWIILNMISKSIVRF
ncbi:hypothetical protein [Methylomonas rapida]|uniref:Uncharacterized protein n=1 Tax=Methylomonas rapida TaxID=2963939 RepID=A0ABY7GIS9_9GAMM|nr:hypothetical protein [Methylomonas rapida]WAR44571.1 hypothetical protein NM686_019830 [Methylomonas rapida]